MKIKTSVVLALTLICAFNFQLSTAHAQGTAFTYQGRLTSGTNTANGSYDLTFALFNASSGAGQMGATVTNPATFVSNGLFTVTLDFGANFPGANRWLEIGVRTNGNGAFAALSPRQALTPTPYAIFASTSSNVAGGVAVKSLNNLKDDVTLSAGSNITITPSGNTLTLASAGVGGSGIWSALNNNAYYNAGNVGIGTSTPAHRLSLSGGPTWTDNGWAGAVELVNGAAIGWQANQGGQRFGMGHSFGGFYLFRTASDPGSIGNPALYDFVVDDSGNVGIGTTAPTPGIRLEVNGAALLTPGGSGGHIQFGSPNAESGMTIIGSARADVRFDGSTLKLLAGPLGGPPASTSGVVVGTNGNVGIGTTTPGSKLSVQGDVDILGGRIALNREIAVGTTVELKMRPGDNVPLRVEDSAGLIILDLTYNPNELTIFGDAQKTLGGTSWGVYSDRRLKQDVRVFKPGLDEILQLRPVRFHYRDNPKRGLTSNHEEFGFIAQEVREVIPEAVTEDKDGYLSLKADPIHWAAINAIRELNTKLEEQHVELKKKETEMTQLREKNDSLEKRLEALEQIGRNQKTD